MIHGTRSSSLAGFWRAWQTTSIAQPAKRGEPCCARQEDRAKLAPAREPADPASEVVLLTGVGSLQSGEGKFVPLDCRQ